MKKILLIEDEADFREAIAFALEGEGYKVLQAENGAEGIEIARVQIPDLIVSDIMMDSVDGYEAVLSIRQDPRTTEIPVILMTGKADKEGLVHAIELGADDYLTKPFTVPELLEAISVRFKKQEETRKKRKELLTDPRSYLALSVPSDLRTPVAGILGFSKAISREYVDMKKSEILELGRAIQKAAKTIMRVAENFSIIAQSEILAADSAKMEGLKSFSTKDIKGTIEPVAIDCASHYERTEDLHLSLSEGSVACSSEYLVKMAHELIDNAFKFSSKGQKVQVSASMSNGSFKLLVTDFGRGMTPQQAKDVYSFSTLHSRFHDERYFGWGLVVAKRIAELHGGSLELSSAGITGTIAMIELPKGGK